MKTGRTLSEVLTELQRQDEAKKDFIAPSWAFHLRDDGKTLELGHLNDARTDTFDTTPLFHRQVANTLNIPVKYYDLMKERKPDLLAENVNAWFCDKGSNYMVRSMDYGEGDVARALLSDRYRRIDNLEIASAVLPHFAGKEGIEMVSCEVTEDRLYFKLVNHRLEMAVVGDQVQAGVMISNSEVGLGAVSIQPLVYTLACLNGMVVNSLSHRRTHIGRTVKTVEDSFYIYSDEAIEAEDKAFMLKLRDAALSAFDEARFTQIVRRLEESAHARITGRVQDVVELTGRNYNLNQGEQDRVLDYLIQGGDLSLYGLGNAITRTSQDIESYDRATALEGIGWNVINMSPSDWKMIND